jgi:hypothetical protein
MASPVHLTGVIGRVRNSFAAHLRGLGVKSVTFYLDGRKAADRDQAESWPVRDHHQRDETRLRCAQVGRKGDAEKRELRAHLACRNVRSRQGRLGPPRVRGLAAAQELHAAS